MRTTVTMLVALGITTAAQGQYSISVDVEPSNPNRGDAVTVTVTQTGGELQNISRVEVVGASGGQQLCSGTATTHDEDDVGNPRWQYTDSGYCTVPLSLERSSVTITARAYIHGEVASSSDTFSVPAEARAGLAAPILTDATFTEVPGSEVPGSEVEAHAMVTFSWTYEGASVTGFRLERADTEGACWHLAAEPFGSGAIYKEFGVGKVSYRVRGYNSVGYGDPSNSVTIRGDGELAATGSCGSAPAGGGGGGGSIPGAGGGGGGGGGSIPGAGGGGGSTAGDDGTQGDTGDGDGSSAVSTLMAPVWVKSGAVAVWPREGRPEDERMMVECGENHDQILSLVNGVAEREVPGTCGGNLRVHGARPGSWYRQGRTIAPLVPDYGNDLVEPLDPGGVEIERGVAGTKFTCASEGCGMAEGMSDMGIIPHLPGLQCDELVTPYWEGPSGGIVGVLQDGRDEVAIEVRCGSTRSTPSRTEDEDGILRYVVAKHSYCSDGEVGEITITGMELGAWYWINKGGGTDEPSRASYAAPLVCAGHLDSAVEIPEPAGTEIVGESDGGVMVLRTEGDDSRYGIIPKLRLAIRE